MDITDLARPCREQSTQEDLFGGELAPSGAASHWWGLPEYSAKDISPQRSLTVHFVTNEDCRQFCETCGINITAQAKSLYWPQQPALSPGQYFWAGTPSPTRYPVYIPSKGRYGCATTGKLLDQAGVNYRFVVEPPEAEQYERAYPGRVLVLPFHDLGQGSIPARNWIWEHAATAGARWHWIIDDNITEFARCHGNRRLQVKNSSAPLRVVEDIADRYQNVAFAGLAAKGFADDRTIIEPLTLNTRVYSVTLIRTDLPYRWRGRYNEDTDICLRALKDGWCTLLLKAFLMHKAAVCKGDGKSGMPGGNADSVYNTGDYRLAFAESLRNQHPDCVKVVWKFGRWHHQVDYSGFKRNALILKPGVVPIPTVNNYGLTLHSKDDALLLPEVAPGE